MQTVGTQALADHLGVSRQRIQQYVHLGMPKLGRGKYDPDACKRWQQDTLDDTIPETTSLSDERARYYKSQADLAEWKVSTAKAEHVNLEVLAAALSNVVSAIVLELDTWIDQAPDAGEMNARRECAWRCRERVAGAVESVCSDIPGVSEHQAAGLRNRRQLR